MLHLLADVGGTNTRVGLADGTGLIPDSPRSFANAGFTGLAPLLRAYLDDMQPGPVTALCAGVAGPVTRATAHLTNHHWVIDTQDLAAASGAARIRLINDLQAQGYALDDLAPDDITPLFPGTADPNGPRLVLGLGTGCNIAVVHRIGGHLFVPPSETGHTSLPDRPDMRALFDDLRDDHAHLALEAALSGPGLANIHAALTGARLDPADITAATAPDTLRHFITLLGTVAGNLCLSHMATGGLYLIGGTARALAPHLADRGFHAPFTYRGPYTPILQAIPVSLITDDAAALKGCGRYLCQTLE